MKRFSLIFCFILALFHSIFFISCSEQKNHFTLYIEDKLYNWGYQYEWLILSTEGSTFYTLNVPNNGKNKFIITSYDKNWNSTSEEKENVEVGQILKVRGNVVSLIVDKITFKVPEEFYPKAIIDGIFDIKWNENFEIVAEKLESNGHVIEKINEPYIEYLRKIFDIFDDREFNNFIETLSDTDFILQNISMTGEFAGLPADFIFNFDDSTFHLCNISFKDNKSENDFKKINDYLIRQYGKPSVIESNGKIYLWILNDNYSISSLLTSLQISVSLGDELRFSKR